MSLIIAGVGVMMVGFFMAVFGMMKFGNDKSAFKWHIAAMMIMAVGSGIFVLSLISAVLKRL